MCPKVEFRCAHCGKPFFAYESAKQVCCSNSCAATWKWDNDVFKNHKRVNKNEKQLRKTWFMFKRLEFKIGIRVSKGTGRNLNEIDKKQCYLKEARAILRGLHWENKNHCVKLPGDEP